MTRKILVACVLLMGSTGCGAKTANVIGTVSFHGKPIRGGSVILYCEDQQIVRGIIGPDGSFAIPNVPLGEALITVRSHTPIPEGFGLAQKLPPMKDGPIQAPSDHRQASAVIIPEHYGIPEESRLKLRVVRGQQVFDIDLVP
ncbi:MAG: carboxypeptidase-like regulatory domain-containing protein [Planctomycetes bacterium]|nr:carboxypeptidase-like regulatory domain-containing protein [Planctomycetota bacterium]